MSNIEQEMSDDERQEAVATRNETGTAAAPQSETV
jgi:hypothetical protein